MIRFLKKVDLVEVGFAGLMVTLWLFLVGFLVATGAHPLVYLIPLWFGLILVGSVLEGRK